jgi:hypothetical protein
VDNNTAHTHPVYWAGVFMGKGVFFTVLLIIATGGISAQDYKNEITGLGFWAIPDRKLKFMSEIAVELGLWSAGIRYNWFLSDYFSLGARAFIHNNIFSEKKIWGFDFIPRLMTPSFLTPYLECGIGYGNIGGYKTENGELLISPGLGLNLSGLYVGLVVPMKFEPDFDYYFRAIFGLAVPIEELFSIKKQGKAIPVQD